jgi:hypothetical protein
MTDAHERGYLSRPVHYGKVCAFFCNPDLTEPLRELIVQSSLPLRAIERDFAVDSTGFSTSKFVRWYGEKYRRAQEPTFKPAVKHGPLGV